MKVRVKVPKLGLTIEEVTLAAWEAELGATVEAGAVIATVEADKATYEIVAPTTGRLIARAAEPGTVLPIGAELAVIDA
ncbi:lipoyl domain-containing protein [Azospirillum himalayense]|uniref:Lipoyl domain-containing protein n=1 Tax=Azospirillum himalayense TaxID=654847 RepID=A0ABW0GGX9_9PROT